MISRIFKTILLVFTSMLVFILHFSLSVFIMDRVYYFVMFDLGQGAENAALAISISFGSFLLSMSILVSISAKVILIALGRIWRE